MKNLYDVIDETEIMASAEKAFSAIVDLYDGHSHWWMPFVSCKLLAGESSKAVGSTYKVTIHGVFPISFIGETIEAKPNELLKIRYIKGAFSGEGLWKFEPSGSVTKISFRWEATPVLWFLKMVALFFPLSKNHSQVMKKGFEGLKKSLIEEASAH